MQNYIQEDSMLIEKIVYEVKSQGIFDQFRKECIADVDTKPAYQNLRQRVEGSVSGFLNKQKWSSDMNKNHVREMLRKNIYESGFLETGVERIVDQVVNPKINSIFLPKVTELVYKFFGIQKPGEDKNSKQEPLLPTDLEAVSPESEKRSEHGNDEQNLDDSKIDEDESPPFEPLEEQGTCVAPEETSIDSHMSGFSGLMSHDSNSHEVSKPSAIETSNQESVTSKQSSDRLSIVMSDDNETKMEVDEQKLEKKKDEKEKKSEGKSKDDKGHRSRHDSRSDRKDKDRKDHKDRHSSKHHDKSKERKSSTSRNGKSEKDKEKDKSKSHNSSHKHSSSSRPSHKDSSSSSKDRDKSKSKSSSSSNRDKESSKDKRKDDTKKDSKKHQSDSKTSSSSEKLKRDDRHSKSSSRSKDKKDSKSKEKNKDCESESKKKYDRRSTDRDSNDGHSSLKSSSSSFESFSSNAQTSQQEKKDSSNTTNSGDSGNSDPVEGNSSTVVLDDKMQTDELSISVGTIKLFKPKFASNIHEARRLMKIRKKLAQIENERNLQLQMMKKIEPVLEKPPESPPLPSVNVSAATWDALEAKLNESIANENYYKESYYDTPDTPEKKEKPAEVTEPQNDDCYYFEKQQCSKTERYVKFVSNLLGKLEKDLVEKEKSKKVMVACRKRKLTEVNSDVKNNNKKFNIEVHENFSLPLSPAESDNSIDKKSDISEASDKKNDSDAIDKAKRIIRAPANKKSYSNEDLYKPRLSFSSSRRRLARKTGID